MSPTPGRSTLMQSAPNQASNWVQVGPDWTWVKSRMRTPSSALPSAPQALVEGFDALNDSAGFAVFFAAGLRAAALRGAAFFAGAAFLVALRAGFFAAVLALAFALDFFMVVILFLAQGALRIEVADAAALRAGGRI